ncbi:hypothetical protein pEp_SNUABM10_00025 [Erwinia phage pEp_SNUABM_10]|nr:hypothetical protein pEp_SNUABM03_00022 [Erwinia phage pEp_SNUABM_03]QOC57679.1 hypothetical protein pEp_SNUABM04_00025 [Erwinia phage pEp_SNUABM_04]QOC57729.1 hypothetical protein pEp_SNUABM10_00025 [Erwinia phage pEp_SNUABM_10]
MDAGKLVLIVLMTGLVARSLWMLAVVTKQVIAHREIKTKS